MQKYLKITLYTVLFVLSGLILSGCTVSEEKISKYEQIVESADMLLEAREYSSAMEKLNEAALLIPSRVDAYERIIDVFILKNRLDDAKKLVDESANRLNSEDRGLLYTSIGDAYYESRDFKKALSSYELAKGIFETNETTQLGIAKVYVQQSNFDGAQSILKGKFSDKLDVEAKIIYSYLLSTTNPSKAKELLNSIEPTDEWVDDYEEWIAILDSLTDDELFNSAKLSRVYINAGYPTLAVSLLEPKKKEMVEYVDGMYLLGKAYYEMGKYSESIKLLSDVTAISDLNQYIYWTIARSYFLTDDINSAFSFYESAISYGGDNANEKLYQEFLDLLNDNNQTTRAGEVLRKADKIFNKPWVDLYYLKLSYFTKQNEKVVYYTDKIEIEELEGNYKREYLYWKSRIAIENNRLDDAKRALDIFWDIDKFDCRYNLLMAQLSFQEGNIEDARIYSKKAIEYDTQRLVTDEAQKLLARID
jgi:tetratricopeptide (TPR) repeat protein